MPSSTEGTMGKRAKCQWGRRPSHGIVPVVPLMKCSISLFDRSTKRDASANGPLLKLPAGDLYISAKAGDAQSWQGGTSDRLGLFQSVSLSRNDANGQLNVDIPLTSRRNHVLGFLGDLSVNANGAGLVASGGGNLVSSGGGNMKK